ncbi:hypothetical protein BV898_00131 [Hypsibius exemplaris]|uniref:HTH CENPB-type domain-containing protein n=1 Tax=Hypsibius exemplaris TaxID=2072580 RepID=A0A1W0XEV7_HYPEX|nr:hypothetical protein BV898_00131 [Hypsibius exemplaris]
MKRICEITKAAYVKVEAELAIIHDADLTKWARDAATSVELSGFRVSKSWILKFKKMHIIVDRKITEADSNTKFIWAGLNAREVCTIACNFSIDAYAISLEKVRACVQSITKMTHLYTIMVTIDANDKLLSPLFIVMQKITGNSFGPQVQQGLFTASNILVTVDRTVLVIDSWSTYKNQELLDAATPKGREVQIVTVPPKTTPLCQPLDVYGFRL